jgi:hypothetical protein
MRRFGIWKLKIYGSSNKRNLAECHTARAAAHETKTIGTLFLEVRRNKDLQRGDSAQEVGMCSKRAVGCKNKQQ